MNDFDVAVYVVDDEESVARALVRLVQSQGYRARPFHSSATVLESWAQESGPACLLLDVRMPDMSGIELQRHLGPDVPVVMLSGYADVPSVVQAMLGGAVDFLQKPVTVTMLLPALAKACRAALDAYARRLELQHLRDLVDRLTPREREVMAWVVTGRLNKQVASELGTVEKTIKAHRARVMQKLEVGSLPDLVRMADRVGVRVRPGAMRASD